MNSLIDSYCAKDSLVARPCSVCISPDRLAIDQYMLEGHPATEVLKVHPELKYNSVVRHYRLGHITSEIAKRVDRAARLNMSSILDTLQRSVDRMEKRLTDPSDSEVPVQYVPQFERGIIEGTKTLVTVNVEATKLQIEKDKLDLAKRSDNHSKLLRGLQFIKDHAPDMLEAYCKYVDQV